MGNFIHVGDLEILPVMARLAKMNPATWKGLPARGETGNPLIGLGASIVLRGHDKITKANWLDDLPVKDVDELKSWATMKTLLEQARKMIMSTGLGQQFLSGQPGRAMLSVLRPGSTIFWHEDNGPYHEKNIRFHIPLVTNRLCLSYSGPETVHMPAGSLWYFNNRVRHSAANWGEFDRVTLIFEMRRIEGAGHA